LQSQNITYFIALGYIPHCVKFMSFLQKIKFSVLDRIHKNLHPPKNNKLYSIWIYPFFDWHLP